MTHPAPGSDAWLHQVREEPIDPDRPIIDPHHHLWHSRGDWGPYLLGQLWADTGAGHNIRKTVFIECRASYRADGPEHLRSVGEAEFVAGIARASREGGGGAEIAGFVGHTDLRQGEAQLREVLAAQADAAQGLFRGIRHAGARDPHPEALTIPGRGSEGLYADADFRAGVALLGRLGHTYDTWHYHHQNPAFAALARAVPGTTLVLDHFGTPLGVGGYAGQRDAIFSQWQRDIEEIARCPNVVAKLGGLAMPDNGFGWDRRALPANSDELVEAQGRYYRHTIECFGPQRCMFESNFPVDRRSLPYVSYWNAMKKIAKGYSAGEQEAMFWGTAQRVYRI
ncbi:amidohydrolase [Pseudorhodoferax sp. Leaf265]|uniref:amidohydrolase family protein n=1 Tax=Pseudorhodoferax sp. Leaf265 TaxID=1736315 RepID=UPI0006F7F4AF|nr:amidohydrolase family protein [Pseudorhodoferax sp. Leaf265]KQP03001.1 amidohydrolase [Pseudorhodoferax sp. Leaf265]